MADHDGFPFPFAPTRSRPTRSQQEHGQPCKVGFSAFPQSLSPPAGLELFAPTIPPSDAIDGQLLPSVLSPPALETMIAFPTSEGPFQPLAAIVDALQDAENTFNRTFAEAIPCPIDLPTPPHDKPRRLRLPSFQVLGIASPHPDALSPGIRKIPLEPIPGFTGTTLDAAADAEIEGGLDPRHTVFGDCVGHAGRPRVPMALPGETITPPEESSMTGYSSGQPNPGARIGPEAMAEQIEASTGTGGSGGTLVTRNPSRQGDQSIDDATAMDDQALRGIINKILPYMNSSSRLQVLSHALPCPKLPGHAYARIIEAVRSAMPSGRMTWINLLHAVPGRFNMSDLPTSPPDTPGQPLGDPSQGEDYFTTKTFESARQTIDYGSGDSPQLLRNLGQSSNALAPPGSVDMAIIERYVPPASTREFDTMFSIVGPSLLVDRLVELSRDNGHLILIYPTRKGAEDFCSRYLRPIIDPLMRGIIFLNEFSHWLSDEVAAMYAAGRMLEFDIIRLRIEDLCRRLSRHEEPLVRRRLGEESGPSSSFAVSYAQRHLVCLERAVWAEWWTKQEKLRVRAAVERQFARPNRSHPGTSRQAVLEDILEGVANRPYGPEADPANVGIEVGVFVVRRMFAPST